MQKIARSKFLALSGGAAAACAFPVPAFAAGESPLVLHTATGSIYGTLTLPAGAKRVPAVLIIAGSGPTDRDGNSPLLAGKSDSLKLLALGLAARDVASVRFDKRGVAASAAAMTAEKDIRFDTYVDDAANWIAMLANDRRFSRIAVAGHSEGSLIGMIAAQRGQTGGFVSLDGAGRPIYTILREQYRPALTPELLAQFDTIIARLQAGKIYSGAIPPELQSLFRPSVQPYLISWFRYDPAAEISKLKIPAAIVQGTADVQVSMADAEALKRADPSARLVVVPDMNHELKISPDISSRAAILAGYTNPKLPVAPAVIDAVVTAANGSRAFPK